MTARPFSPERRRWPLSAAVALVLLAMAMAAGCIGCLLVPTGCIEPAHLPDRDIVVVKITPNATVQWSKVLGTIGYNRIYPMIQMPDNNLVVYSPIENKELARLVKLSGKTGDILWKIPVWDDPACGPYLASGKNGDIISAGNQNICRIKTDGTIVWNRTIPLKGDIYSVREMPDNGYLVGGSRIDKYKYGSNFEYDDSGNLIQNSDINDRKEFTVQAFVVRIDSEGQIVWQTFLGKKGLHDPVRTLVNTEQGSGYTAQTESAVIQLAENGTLLNISRSYYLPDINTSTSFGKELKRYQNPHPDSIAPPRIIIYDEQGNAVAKQTLTNISKTYLFTDDGGYVAAVIRPRENSDHPPENRTKLDERLNIIRYNPDESIMWEARVDGVVVTDVVDILQTSDGGYALVCVNEVLRDKKK